MTGDLSGNLFLCNLLNHFHKSSRFKSIHSPSPSQIISIATMSYQTTGIALIAVIFFLIRYLNRTDTPKVKNLPEIPGIPLFGNLLQFGSSHAKVAGELATKYGPVFQVRLGNRVRLLTADKSSATYSRRTADHICKHFRLRPSSVDYEPVSTDLAANIAHLPYGCVVISRFHDRHLTLG